MRPTTARTHPVHLLIIGTFLLLVGAVPASATAITYSYTGTVTTVDALLAGQFSIGQTLSGFFTYDDSGPDLAPGIGNEYLITATANSGAIGGYAFSSGAGRVGFASGSLASVTYDLNPLTGAAVGGLSPAFFSFGLFGGNSALFDATDPATLPLHIPAVGNFPSTQFLLAFGGTTGPPVIGTITSVSVAPPAATVPEPASMLLLGTGLAGLAARRFRRRK